MSLTLALQDIRRVYAAREVLRGVSTRIGPGVTALMGPNGVGKSTLLRLAALLEPPTSGRLEYLDNETPLPPGLALRRRVTLVLPRAGIFNASVRWNAAYGLRVRGVPRSEAHGRARAALERVGLQDRLKQNALSLSSGESQRLALARALVIEPSVLLLDEPTASVDEENREIIEDLIKSLRRGADGPVPPTVVLTTHDRAQAERLADRILVMSGGRLEQSQ